MIFIRIVILILLFISLLTANSLQVLSLIIKPISPHTFRRVSASLAAGWWWLLAFCLERFFSLTVQISSPPKEWDSNSFVISNHQSFIDVLVILILARKAKRLSSMKWFVKDKLKWLPLIGWGLYLLDCIFLKRNWDQDQKSIQNHFRKILSYSDPIWLISFVEGTRKTSQNLQRSRKYAENLAQRPFDHVLYPRVKGFYLTSETLKDRLEGIYDLTLSYSGGPPNLKALFHGEIKPVSITLNRYALSSIPFEREANGQWLLDRFREKDGILGENSLLSNRT